MNTSSYTITYGESEPNITLNPGDLAYVEAGGTVTTLIAEAGATVGIAAGGLSISTMLSGGTENERGTASATTIFDGGTENVTNTGTTTGSVINFGGGASVDGTASGTVVNSGGADYVYSTGIANNTIVSSGGAMIVLPGAVVTSTTVEDGGSVISTGAVYIAANQVVSSAASVTGVSVGSGGDVFVLQGGTLLGATFGNDGRDLLYGGGVASDTFLSANGEEFLDGGTAVSTTVTGGAFEYVNAASTVDLSILSGGYQALDYGATAISATLDSGAIQYIEGGTALDTIVNSGGEIFLYGTTEGAASGTRLNLGGKLELAFLPFLGAGSGSAALDPTTDILTITEGGSLYTQQLSGDYTGEYFHLSARGGGPTGTQTDVTLSAVPCYRSGTRIMTERGEVMVEMLRSGDRVITASGTLRPIRWIGHRSYNGWFIAGRRDLLPIVIRAGALADKIPSRDLSVSPRHAMFLDGTLVPAERLVNGVTVIQLEQVDELTYLHVELDSHDILLAEGAPSESFVDHDSRAMFQNAHECQAHPPLVGDPKDCFPRIEDGETLAAIRSRVARRAGLAADHADDAAAHGPLEGRIDVLDDKDLSGWAYDAARPHTPVKLEILIRGETVAVCVANGFRADLRQAGKGDGHCSFSVRLPVIMSPAMDHAIQVRRVADQAVLSMGMTLIHADPAKPGPLDGRVDVCNDALIEGWAIDIANPGVPVRLEIFHGETVLGRCLANRYRPDLEQAGKAAGWCSFSFHLDPTQSVPDAGRIGVRRAGDQAWLTGPVTPRSAA